MKPTLVDLFCGAGGMSLGLKQAGFEPVFAADFDKHACATYRLNIGDHVQEIDLSAIEPERFAEMVAVQCGSIDLVAGGPPCQGWSIQRRGDRADARNDLTLKFAELAAALKPMAIVMENVPTILGARGRAHLLQVESILHSAGYNTEKTVLNAASYGVPQVRRRAVLVALRQDLGPPFSFPKASHPETAWRTVRDAIGDLPAPPMDGSEHPDYPNHRLVKVSALNLQRLSHVPEGGGRLDVPEHLQLPCHAKDNGHRHLDVFGRLSWDRPAGTITAMFDNFTRGRFAHPSETRNITGREGARLQSFPDSYVFLGPKKDVARQIGNAVAPLLAKSLGEALLERLLVHEVEKRSVAA